MATNLQKRMDRKRELIPRRGYVVVAVDDYESPGEELYLVSKHSTKRQAESAAKKHRRVSSEKTFVYGPEDR